MIDEKTDDYENIEEKVDYLNIAHALKDMVPGSFGDYLFYHFQPYLQIKLESEEQKDAYRNILAFCDRTNIKSHGIIVSPYLFKRKPIPV